MSTVQWGPSQTTSPNTVTIVKQTWMNSNLQTTRYNNGDPIPEVQDTTRWGSLTTGAWCWYENDSTNGAIYGRLYNWYAANDPRGIAPPGWRLPTESDWDILVNQLGGYGASAGAGTAMKSTSGWFSGGNGTNSSGFNGLPGAFRASNGVFASAIGVMGQWWSSTTVFAGTQGRNLIIQYNNSFPEKLTIAKTSGFSIRLVKI